MISIPTWIRMSGDSLSITSRKELKYICRIRIRWIILLGTVDDPRHRQVPIKLEVCKVLAIVLIGDRYSRDVIDDTEDCGTFVEFLYPK